MGWRDTIQTMVDGYDSQISALQTQISALRNKADDVKKQSSALTQVLSSQSNSMTSVLNAKAGTLTIQYGGFCNVVIGRNFGSVDLTDWYIYYHGGGGGKPGIVYKYGGVGWDNDKTILCLLEEFGFVSNYINTPVNEGLYGLDSMHALLINGIDKLEDMIHEFETARRRLESFAKTGISGCLINPYF